VAGSALATHTHSQQVGLLLGAPLPAGANVTCLLSQAWDGPSSDRYGSLSGSISGGRKVRCDLPVMTAEGPVDVQVVATAAGQELISPKVSLWFATELAVSFDRHPYYAVDEGELLVRTNVSRGRGGCYEVHARLDDASSGGRDVPVILEAHDVPGNGNTVLKVDFRQLPAKLDAQVDVTLRTCGEGVESRTVATQKARLIRVPEHKRGGAAVDHKRRTLIVDGRPFFSLAWFSMYLFYGVEATIESLRDMSRRGANSVVIYNLVAHSLVPRFKDRGGTLPLSDSMKVLDAANALGIKVHVYLVDLCDPITNRMYGADYTHLKEAIFTMKDHPAVLSWYVADDASGPGLPDLYKQLKDWDPYHLVSIAITGPGNIYAKKYVDGADIIMLETYEAYSDGPYNVMSMFNRWPTQFMPYITCGRAWTTDEDNAVITRQVFRSQFWHAIAAGTTGEVWFAYRNSDNWNEPGHPLQGTSTEVSFEVLDMARALMTSEDWSDKTAIKPVTVEGRYTQGERSVVHGDKWSLPVRAKAFREESGCITLVVTNGYDYPMDVTVSFAWDTPGVHDAETRDVKGLVLYEGTSLPRFVRAKDGRLTETLESLGSRVIRFNGTSSCATPQPKPGSQPQGKNRIQNPSFEYSAAYASSPDDWRCDSTPVADSSCFTDTHVSLDGRHAGRFVTGRKPGELRIMPKLQVSNEQAVSFEGSIWAQADQPMTLSVWQVHWPKVWLNFDNYADSPQELAKIELSEHWRKLNFTAQLTKEHHLYFTVDRPGVLWLDQADLSEVQDPMAPLARVADPKGRDWVPLLAQDPFSGLHRVR